MSEAKTGRGAMDAMFEEWRDSVVMMMNEKLRDMVAEQVRRQWRDSAVEMLREQLRDLVREMVREQWRDLVREMVREELERERRAERMFNALKPGFLSER